MRVRVALLACLLTVLAADHAAAQQVTRGSTLQATPLTGADGGDCSAHWFPNSNDLSQPYYPTNSGQPSCTWYQGFVFGDANDPRTGYVPADGTVNTITVKTAASPAPLTFLVLRQLTPAKQSAPSGSTECCFFVREIGTFQPNPNTTTTFTVNAAVENNRQPNVITQDIIGFSAASGVGSIPLAKQDDGQTGRFNEAAHFTNGEMTSGYFKPKLGAIANDAGGGRHETNTYGGFDTLLQYTFTPNAPTPTPTPTPGPTDPVANPPGMTGPTPLSPTDVTRIGGGVLRPIGAALQATIDCLQPTCDGSVRLLARGAATRAVGAVKKPVTLGSGLLSLKQGKGQKVRVKLNAKGRKAAARGKTRVTLVVDLGAIGTLSKSLTLVPPRKRGR